MVQQGLGGVTDAYGASQLTIKSTGPVDLGHDANLITFLKGTVLQHISLL
jgi:hypothetical protein